MPDGEIGRLERGIPLREVWKHEARNFTQWLEQNIDILNEALDLELVNVDREQAAGDFSVDLVAEDASGGTVIIENQLGKSDHDHLGKLITYLTAMSAKMAIWIVSVPRPEHVAAITWLNQAVTANFYMVKVEAVRIGASPPAALFTLIVGPSEEGKDVGQVRKDMAERYGIRRRWWAELLKMAGKKTRLHASISPGEWTWISAASGIRGLTWVYTLNRAAIAAELYIDRGPGSGQENKRLFDNLANHRAEIERDFGSALSWERMDSKQACRIRFSSSDGGYRSPPDDWARIQEVQVDGMVRLERALRPFLAQLADAA